MINFYDFETADGNHSTHILQYAAVSTDDELNIIKGSETNLIAKPSSNALPAPIAFMIHMLDLENLKQNGLSERELVQHVVARFMHSPNSQQAGFNTMAFDDKVLQHACFRNMFNPYEHQYVNGNSRFDIYKLVQLIYAFRPETLSWGKKEDGSVSLKLESLSAANGIIHENAHDALSDVYATIELAKMIKDAQPKLYAYSQTLTKKENALRHIQSGDPLLHVNFRNGKDNRYTSLIHPLSIDSKNRNKYIVANLREDPYNMLHMSPQELRHFMFTKREELGENAPRVPVSQVAINDMPLIVPSRNMLTPELASSINIDIDECYKNLEAIQNSVGFKTRIQEAYVLEDKKPVHIFDTLWGGEFISKRDNNLRKELTVKSDEEIDAVDAVAYANKADNKTQLLELIVSMKSQPANEIEKALLYRQLNSQFFDSSSRLTFDAFYQAVANLRIERELSPGQEVVLSQVISHVEDMRAKFEVLQESVLESSSELEKEIEARSIHWLKPYLNQQYGNGIHEVFYPEGVSRRQPGSSGPSM